MSCVAGAASGGTPRAAVAPLTARAHATRALARDVEWRPATHSHGVITMIVRIAIALSLVTTAACSKDGGGTCDKAVANTIRITKEAFPDMPAPDKGDMLAKCKQQPAKAQECAANAKDLEALMACGAGG
jgi:hypothetical protein